MKKKALSFREVRQNKGITQAGLATLANVSRRTVATVEKGGHISTRSLTRIEAALGAQQVPSGARPPLGMETAPMSQPTFSGPLPAPPPEKKTIQIQGKKIQIETKRFNDLPIISPNQAWDTVTAVRQALIEFQNGQFSLASDMVEAMMADDRIRGVTAQRIDGLLGLPFAISAEEEDNESAAKLAEEATKLWPRIAPDEALRDLWKWGRFLGIGVAEKIYDTESKDGWVPKLKVWHPRYVWWNWLDRCYYVNTQDGAVALREGDRHWVLYTPYGYYRGWMEGLIRSLAIPWLFRQFGYRDWGRYNEVHGIPIRAIIEPSEWDDEDKQQALREVAMLASESVIRLPQKADGTGFDMKLIEATSRTYDSFKLALDKADSSIAIVILGQNLTTEVKGGAYSAAQVHERVAAAIIRSDSNTLGGTLREQVLVEWAALNHNQAELAPKPGWDTEPPTDKSAAAQALATVATAFSTLRNTQLPVDFAKLAEIHEVPLLAGVEIPDFVPPAPVVPPGEEPPDGEDPEEPQDDDEPDETDKEGDKSKDKGQAQNDEDEEDQKGKTKARSLRSQIVALKGAFIAAKLGRRERAPVQGQIYIDDLGSAGSKEGARILAGDVRALKKIISEAKPDSDGKIDAAAIKMELLRLYGEMKPDKLARVLSNCRLLAELSGRYSVIKEVVS